MKTSVFTFLMLFSLSASATPLLAETIVRDMAFNALGTPLSGFKIKRMKAKGIKDPQPEPGTKLSGRLTLPKGDGPFPLVILSHDCRGIQPFHQEYAKSLSSWGYGSFLIDTYGARGVKSGTVCPNIAKWDTKEFIASRSGDIYGALKFLKTNPKIDGARTALLGWDRDSTMSAVALQGIAASNPKLKPLGAVVVSPDCRRISSGEFAVPILVIAAGKDDWWPVKSCTKMKAAADNGKGAAVTLVVLKDAQHGFDDRGVGGQMILSEAFNPNKNPTKGATFSYHKQSFDEGLVQMKMFLGELFR